MSKYALSCPPVEAEHIFASISIDATFGVAYLGVAISAMAYGTTCCQTFYYYRSEKAKRDGWLLKSLVALLWIMTTVQEGFHIHGTYWSLITNLGDPCTLVSKMIWSISAGFLINSPIAAGVQGFQLYRIWKLSHNIYVTGTCSMAILAGLVFYTVFTARVLVVYHLQDALTHLRWLAVTSVAAYLVADGFITAALVYYLYKSRTGFRRSGDLVTKLIALSVSTGGFTTLITMLELIAYKLGTHGFYVVFLSFLVGKSYLNAMLTTLNMRSIISYKPSKDSTQDALNSFHLSRLNTIPSLPIHPPVTLDMVDLMENPVNTYPVMKVPSMPSTEASSLRLHEDV